jgi:NAD(P)-dependent dehydrogenase (short-subunit alcohol dehydrogenase family)
MLDIDLKGAWLVARRVIPRDDAPARRRDHQQLLGGGSARHGPSQPLCGFQVGPHRAHEIVSHRARTHGIRVNPIYPTDVNTPMNDGLAEVEGLTPRQIAERSAGNLLPVPWVEPEDVAQAVLYLASERARFLTGAGLVVDAGLLSR